MCFAGELRPVIATLTRLFDETSKALGGSQATQAKKREIEDNSRKIGALFAKLNSGDISPNVSSKLVQLCSALDSSDFATAMHLQVHFYSFVLSISFFVVYFSVLIGWMLFFYSI